MRTSTSQAYPKPMGAKPVGATFNSTWPVPENYSNMKNLFLLLAISVLYQILLQGQEPVLQPRILILPYTASGENALETYEANFAYRTAITEIANALNERGFRPDDLQEIINRVKENEAISTLKGVHFDPIERILQYATSDIVIKAEVYIHTDIAGSHSVQLNLRAVDKVSSKAMYAMNFDATPHFRTDDYGYLARRALTEKDQISRFVEGLNASFDDIRVFGRTISCIIEQNEHSRTSLGDEVNDNYDILADILIDWVKLHAYKGNFRIRSNTENQLHFDEIRIPLQDEAGQHVRPDDFAREFRRYIAKVSADYLNERVDMPRPTVNNGTIRIILP
jgi:hypothetical protein